MDRMAETVAMGTITETATMVIMDRMAETVAMAMAEETVTPMEAVTNRTAHHRDPISRANLTAL